MRNSARRKTNKKLYEKKRSSVEKENRYCIHTYTYKDNTQKLVHI